MDRRVEGSFVLGSAFVIALKTPEALAPLQGQLELESLSREAMVAYVTNVRVVEAREYMKVTGRSDIAPERG